MSIDSASKQFIIISTMMHPESPTDQELARFLDAETQRVSEEQTDRERRAVIHARLWDAIDTLEIETVVGSDPADYQKDFNDLLDILRSAQPAWEQSDTEIPHDHMIRMIAADIWDREHDLLIGFSLALEEQLFSTTSAIDKTRIKKQFMAKLITREKDIEQWLELADYLFEGEALDTTRSEDMAIVLQELEQAANLNTTPGAILYDRVAAVFGLADDDDAQLSPKERVRYDILTLATRDITEAACLLAGEETQPNRHEWIYGIFRRYNITDQTHINDVLALTDAFNDAE